MISLQTQKVESWPEAPQRSESRMEHRWGRRRPCRAHVSVSASGGVAGGGALRNVSMSGAFLETALPLPLFAQVSIAVLLHDGCRCREYTGTVVRSEQNGCGIEWSETVPGSVCEVLGCAAHCPFSGPLP